MSRRECGTFLRGLLLVATWLAANGVADAQVVPRTYALMSLVGDELRVVGQEGTTGTLLGQNQVETIRLRADDIDRGVLAQVAKAVVRAEPADKALPIRVNEPRYYEGQRAWVDGDNATLPPEVAEALRGAGVTHAVLVLKHRDDARLRALDVTLGSGKLEGLGFYIDRITPLRREGTGERSIGFLAPYVYLRVVLVDLATGRVLRARSVARADVVSAAGAQAGTGDPWNILDSRAKLNAIVSMVERELDAVLPELLKRP